MGLLIALRSLFQNPMNSNVLKYALSGLVIAFCAWSARELLEYWSFSPYDRVAPWAFLLWLTPLLKLKGKAPAERQGPRALMRTFAHGCCYRRLRSDFV